MVNTCVILSAFTKISRRMSQIYNTHTAQSFRKKLHHHKDCWLSHLRFTSPFTQQLLLPHYDERNLDIFSVFVRSHDLYDEVGNVCRNGLLGDVLDERAKLHR